MPFPANPIRCPWMPRGAAVAGIVWLGAAVAEPPRTAVPSAVVAVPVDDEPGRTAPDELGDYIEQLERHLDWMHRRAAWRGDADTLAEIEAIQGKLAVAKEQHRALCRLCAEELTDTPAARACCQKIDDVMHEVIEEHLALMRRLRARRSGPPRMRRIDARQPAAPEGPASTDH